MIEVSNFWSERKLVLILEELVDDCNIEKVMSSIVVGLFTLAVDLWPKTGAYSVDMTSGGNTFTINFGHCKLYSITIIASTNFTWSSTISKTF